MKQFRKLRVTIEHIETSKGATATVMRVKGTKLFTLEEINTVVNSGKKDWFKQAVEQLDSKQLKVVK